MTLRATGSLGVTYCSQGLPDAAMESQQTDLAARGTRSRSIRSLSIAQEGGSWSSTGKKSPAVPVGAPCVTCCCCRRSTPRPLHSQKPKRGGSGQADAEAAYRERGEWLKNVWCGPQQIAEPPLRSPRVSPRGTSENPPALMGMEQAAMNATTPAGGDQPEYDTDDIDSKI